MSSVGKPCPSAGKESRAPERSAQEKKQGKVSEECQSAMNEEQRPTVKAEDIPALAIRPEHLEKLRAPQPPKDSPKPRAMSRVLVRKTRAPDDHSTGARVAMAKLLPKSAVPQPLDYTDPGGPRFDAKGMVLPHSILGSLEDFRKEMEARGEVEFVKRIPDLKEQQHLEFGEQKLDERTRSPPEHQQDQQKHALEHWRYHMAERRRQQNFISNLLQKPVEDLLMNQANRFRETQEQRELISRGLPALYNGHGAGVGSEFWSAPQRYGDELSGIMATLTQKERGNMKPMTHITQPQSTRLETGNVLSERPMTRAWSHSQYLKHRQNELRNVLSDLDFNQPEMDGLEIVGSSQPFTSDSVEECKKQEQNEEDGSEAEHKENEDPLAIFDDVMLGVELLPALRINGELARWNGSTTSHQDEVGVSVYMTFEAVVGESTCSHLELRNDGSTAIYYSWQKLELPQSFPEARTHVYTQEFYFNTATAVILPGDTERIQFIFKPVCPGIVTEVWKLHTHPVLVGGAMLQVTLKGRALYQDRTAKQRTALELELERRVAESVCRSVLIELLHGIHTPERPGSPDELYSTEDEQFNAHNPNLHFHHEPVEALKGLWEQANWTTVNKLGGTKYEPPHGPNVWDLSMSSLYQVVMSLPLRDGDALKEQAGLCREEALSRYNSLLLQLHQPQHVPVPLTLHAIGLQLWRELVDGVASEALRLRHLLGLPENVNWGDPHHETDILEMAAKDEVLETKAALMIKEKEEKKSAARPTAKEEHGRGKKKPKVDEELLEKELNTNACSTTESAQQHDDMMRELQRRYRHTIHRQVYVLVENMIDALGDLFEEAQQIQENLNKST